jgi:hypothetical protein
MRLCDSSRKLNGNGLYALVEERSMDVCQQLDCSQSFQVLLQYYVSILLPKLNFARFSTEQSTDETPTETISQ